MRAHARCTKGRPLLADVRECGTVLPGTCALRAALFGRHEKPTAGSVQTAQGAKEWPGAQRGTTASRRPPFPLVRRLARFHFPVAIATYRDRSTLNRCKLMSVKVRDLVRLIESDGWKHVRTTGSHRHFKHENRPNVVTVPGSPGDDVPIGTLKSILRSAGLEIQR